MTEAHVPPQSVGNNGKSRERARWVTGPEGASVGRWQPGGLSVYGLCVDCNNLTSGKADPAYLDFHARVAAAWRPSVQRLLVEPGVLPVRVAPGLVARSVLAGMYAINDRLQEHFPELAYGLLHDDNDLRLPEGLRLCLALTLGAHSRLGGPVGYMRVLTRREFHMPLAEVWFPPLAWCLRSSRSTDASLGPEITSTWGDATEWVRYGPELTTDLRNVIGKLPVVKAPQLGAEDWVMLTGDAAMTALEGRPKSAA
jgi:hypothetical protein